MAHKKSGVILISALLLLSFAVTSCELPYTTVEESLATPLAAAGEDFATALPADTMNDMLTLVAQTATAQAATAPATISETPNGLPDSSATSTPSEESLTPGADATPSETPPPTEETIVAFTLTPTITNTPGVTTKPATYTLKKGEFPYCIARRYNIDPGELLALNGLTIAQGQIYQPGVTLKIPQRGGTFPPPRALRTHPTTYTVLSTDTIYSIACYFGDVDPMKIATKNNLTSPYTLQTGKKLNIP